MANIPSPEGPRGPNALELLKQQLARLVLHARMTMQKVKERVKGKVKGDYKEDINKPFDGDATDPKSVNYAAREVTNFAQKVVQDFKATPDVIPVPDTTTGGKVLHKIIQEIQVTEVTTSTAPFIERIIDRVANNPSINPLEILTPLELKYLKEINPIVANRIIDAVTTTADFAAQSTADKEAITTFKKAIDSADIANDPIPDEPVVPEASEPKAPAPALRIDSNLDREGRKKDEDIAAQRDREFPTILERFPEASDQRVAKALLGPAHLEDYIEQQVIEHIAGEEKYREFVERMTPDERSAFLREFNERYETMDDKAKTKLGQHISEELSNDIKRLMGKLFQRVDESAPSEFWEEAAKAGSLFTNTEVLSQALLQQISRLQHENYRKDSWIKKLKFYREEKMHEDVLIETKELYGDGRSESVKRYVSPFANYVEVEFSDYFLTVHNGAKDEVEVRKFLHNAIALFHQPPGEGGYYAKLASYAEHLMPSSSIDVMSNLPNADAAYTASQLEDKLLEADFAKFNWVHTQTLSQLDSETKLTDRSQAVLDYLKQMYPDLSEDEWQYRRALIMGIGDTHSISLRAMEHGARADAPRNMEGGYDADYSSYDKKDAIPFMALNPFNHFNLRYNQDHTLMGNLMFLPVEGGDVGKFGKVWNHNDLMGEMKKTINSFVTGRQVDRPTILADYTNLGKAGSIYTRSGWRNYHSYESFLIGTGQKHDILHSWQNLENVGIHVLNDFIPRMGQLDADFYTPAGFERRKQMFEYVARKYMRSGANLDNVWSDSKIESRFNQIEKEGAIDPANLEAAYKQFFFEGTTHAMVHRIPTKFLRYEKNREVEGRQRAWEVVRKSSGISDLDQYQQAIYDLCSVESLERKIVTRRMREYIDGKKNDQGNKSFDDIRTLHQLPVDYGLTTDKVRKYLVEEMKMTDTDRVERAITVFEKTHEFLEEQDKSHGYIEHFAHKFMHGEFPYAMAVEELERTMIAQRAAGERAPARAFADIGFTEAKTCQVFSAYFEKLKHAATDGKHDFSALVHDIAVAKEQLEVDIDPEHALKIAHHMAALTISFFKKDTLARMLITKPFMIGRKNSLAAEFAGTNRGVWEWNVREVDFFISALESQYVLPKEPFEAGKPPKMEIKEFKIPLPLLDKLAFKYKVRKPDLEFFGGRLRKEFGASGGHIAVEMLNTYIPIALMFIIGTYIAKALKEAEGKE